MPPTTPPSPAPAPVTLFYSYAHEDERLRDELRGHLKILERRRLIAPWYDRCIVPGQDWETEIDEHLDQAELMLLLISKDFVESDYIFGRELKAAMERQAQGRTVVVPVFVRAVNLEPEDVDVAPFMKLQGLPPDLRPVESWDNRDEAWTQVAKGLRATVKQILAHRPPPPPPLAHRPPPPPETGAGSGSGSGSPVQSRPGVAARIVSDVELLDRVVSGVAAQVADAQRARGAEVGPVAQQALLQEIGELIDLPEQLRVLWVDDHPRNNRLEAAALAKLQIEVVAERSTEAALAALARARDEGEPYDLVISDWHRRGEPADSGLSLLRRMRAAGHPQPMVLYHGTFDPAGRARCAEAARAAGAVGEAVLPHELMALVTQALRR